MEDEEFLSEVKELLDREGWDVYPLILARGFNVTRKNSHECVRVYQFLADDPQTPTWTVHVFSRKTQGVRLPDYTKENMTLNEALTLTHQWMNTIEREKDEKRR